MLRLPHWIGLIAALLLAPDWAGAQVDLPHAKLVPVMQVVPQAYDQASLQRDGREIGRYHFGASLRRPFLFPVVGPAGRSLTRLGHPRDPNSHSHHNSVWISHHDVDGVDFWSDRGQGRIVHRRVVRYEDADDAALIDVENAWQDNTGKTRLLERRAMQAIPLNGGQWLLLVDLRLSAVGTPVTLGKSAFGLLGVRMAKTIGVHDGGGTIRNSTGGREEKEVFRKPAQWVDYSGPITPKDREGITLMDHPGNVNHPAHFHVRNDGWMGASLTLEQSLTIAIDKPLVLRYGLWVHSGVPTRQTLADRYNAFTNRAAYGWNLGRK